MEPNEQESAHLTDERKIHFKGHWYEVKSRIQKEYPDLTNFDLKYEEGKDEELLARIEKKTGRNKAEMKNWIESL